ncbi:peptidoglycan editing factor PgeF [Magnetovibrio sp. PR-2]|uniref:peptidoglycan editing factor PgeF n=1 Tax=Magnetovibrio sp. PR-2 TaxID=3120356 RepID=UPI002FCE67AA
MIESTVLSSQRIRHAFCTREGGVSDGIYAGLNCGPGSSDVPENVQENRSRALGKLDLGAHAKLVTCYQFHSPKAVCVTEPWDPADPPKADAMVTDRPGIALGILTADCAPVLFMDETAGVVGAAHAGWKGAQGGVLAATLAEMVALGADIANIHAAVGPCIHQASYEVGEDLRLAVNEASPWADWCFERGAKPDHYQFDLPSYVSGELQRLDVSKVEVVAYDTYRNEDLFFSYRRTTHRGEPDYGRQISLIGLKP